MRVMKIRNVQPGGPSYMVNSSMISLKVFKSYDTDFNLSHEVSSSVGETTGSEQSRITRIELPGGLTPKVKSALPFEISSYTTFMISTSLTLLKFNPYVNVKTSASIYTSGMSSLSYNTNWIEASVIKNNLPGFE